MSRIPARITCNEDDRRNLEVRAASRTDAKQTVERARNKPPGKKALGALGSGVFYTLLGRVEPPALAAVINDWLHTQHGQRT